jgi:hypothetical protein
MSHKKPSIGSKTNADQPTSGWADIVKSALKPVLLAIATSFASVLAYVLTPLNELVNSAIWDERAEILVITQSQSPKQGDVITVDVFVQPKSPVPLSEGLLEIGYSATTLRPGAETTPLLATTTKKISSSTRMFERTLEFISDAPGKAEITAKLKTKSGEFTTVLSLDIAPSADQIFPTHRSFSGVWNIDLGSIHGQMDIRDVARTLNGSYTLSDGSRGQVEGTRDGKTFRVTFYRGSAPSRFFIDATFDPNRNADLEIRGKAKLLLPTGDKNNPWKEDRQSDFYAVAKAR